MISPWLLVGLAFAPADPPAPPPAEDPAKVEFFEKTIRPLLVANCATCHSAETNAKGGLRVDDRNGLIAGGNTGPAVVPGQPDESLLLQAVKQEEGAPKMPPKKRLGADEIAALTKWIEDGATWPSAGKVEPTPPSKTSEKYARLRKEHWAWQPRKDSPLPEVRNVGWPRADLDRFLLAKLEAKGLAPAKDADRLALIRRVTFDLTGLPPSIAEIDAFLNDGSPTAFEAVVDRLLASPDFGERWGRHWLDVARFGESTGSSRNLPYPHAWRYRDYVIDAFRQDKPFDRFLREQIAGDLLPASNPAEADANRVATGFLAIGQKDVNQRFKVRFVMDNVDEQIDAVSRATLALTASCARCHDHKFDPIPQADYYALAGIFTSTDLCSGLRNKMGGGGLDYYDPALLIALGETKTSADAAEKIAGAEKALAEAKAAFEKLRDNPEGDEKAPDGRPKRAVARQKMNRAQNELLLLRDPASRGEPTAMGVRDAKAPTDTPIRLRGEAEKHGPIVPRGFLSVLDVPGARGVDRSASGRRELADWIASEDNPLTPRVYVNRVWAHLFGKGIVRSVDNFGTTGDVPSHPELLDHLVSRFVRDGWSTKRLIRTIVLSRAYGLGAEASEAGLAIDPEDRLVWRHAPRRLEAEEIRDAMLAASGLLDRSRPHGSPTKGLKVIELRNNGPEAARFAEDARDSRHRSVYLPLLRGMVPTSLEVFDFAEQGMVTGRRDATTVAPQALYLLNDPFVRKAALSLAESLLAGVETTDSERIQRAYRLALGRPPSAEELRRASAFLAEYESAARETPAESEEKPPEPVAVAPADDAPKPGEKKPMPPVNPDEVVAPEIVPNEETIRPTDARTAAWAGFAQALFGGAEFRYLK